MANKRICEWSLTIHENDKDKNGVLLFDNLEKYCRDIFSKDTECYFIKHDKDIEEDTQELKTIHIHLAVKFKFNKGRSFQSMKTAFPQSNIIECQSWENTVLYLTHESPQAIKDNKIRYNRNEIVNVFESDISRYYDKPVLEVFDYDKIEEYVNERGFWRITDFGRVFGYSVIAPKWNTIRQIILELFEEKSIELEEQRRKQEEARLNKVIEDNKWFENEYQRQERERNKRGVENGKDND